MKRHDGLWEQVVSWPNLLLAARKARRGKRHRPTVARFEYEQERQLLRLQRELRAGEWQPGPFTTHWITRPKPRLISAAPYRDRVVHHALMNVLEPLLERHFHPGSFACRKGRGTHAAADRLQRLMRRHPYALQCDVQKFFPSIDHETLKGLFRRLLRDRRLLALMDAIVGGSNEQESVRHLFPDDPPRRRRGLPIGNLTSQWFANWYLTSLDHFVTGHLRVPGFVRYCDDFVLFGERSLLREARSAVGEWVSGLGFCLHAGRRAVVPVRAGARFVGYRLWAYHRRLPKERARAFRRIRTGCPRRLAAWWGHICHVWKQHTV